MAAAHDQASRRNHAIGALAARQSRAFLDAIDWDFRGSAEHREHGPVSQEVDGVVTPFAGSNLAAVEIEKAVELVPVKGHGRSGGVGRSAQGIAPGELAGFRIAWPKGHRRLL